MDNSNSVGGIGVLWHKYQRYVIAVVIFAVIVLILAKCTASKNKDSDTEVTEGTEVSGTAADFVLDKELKEDAVPEVNALLQEYYTAYAKDDLEALTKIAYPMTDNEKSYIGVFSQYIKKYDNLKCYTKTGLSEGSYLVSAYYEMEFYGVKSKAYGLDFFYLETDKDGKLYINNLYSPFNFSRTENEMDPTIYSVIIKYGEQEDVVAISNEINKKYEAAIAGDTDLATMIATTIPTAMKDWRETLTAKNDTQQATTENGTQTTEKKDDTAQTTEKKDEKTSEAAQTTEKKDEKTSEAAQTTEKKDEKTSEAAQTTEKKDEKTEKKKKTVKIKTTDNVFVRAEPSTDAEIMERAEKGSKFTKISESDGWTKIKYKGETAYIKSDYVKEVK